MANGLYGQIIPAAITQDDIEIWYSYSPTRGVSSAVDTTFQKLDNTILRQEVRNVAGTGVDSVLEGAYKIHLPLTVFNRKGFYSVYIKPREIRASIKQVSALAEFENVSGLVFDTAQMSSDIQALFRRNGGLVGYRITYLNDDDTRRDEVRIITSNNRVEPVVKQVLSQNAPLTRYRYNNTSSLVFVTVTPSLPTSYMPTIVPFIGETGENVILTNTKFTPVMYDIELTEHDADTISTMLEGDQVFNHEKGLITTFNPDGEIYHQAQTYLIKSEYTGEPIKKVKETKKLNVDYSETID